MKLVILDRDGVINQDSDEYIKSPEEWQPIPGSLAAIARLHQAGYQVAVATNQSGLARGLFDMDTLIRMHDKMLRMVNEAGGAIDGIFFCPHAPKDDCDCRKPKPGLLRQIGLRFRTPLEGVPCIGDSVRDLKAALAVGASPLLVRTGKGLKSEAAEDMPPGVPVHDNLAAAVEALLAPAQSAG
jgi:D-glycero-D-manno-heptose 1,7-bisphosphate phosphatase